jgi:hypothetical protein
VADEVTAIVKEAVDGVLAAEAYNEQMVQRACPLTRSQSWET